MQTTLERIEKIKRLTLIALVSDDYFFETLVLKGGNALDISYDISNRGSLDMDFSMENDFQDIKKIKGRIQELLVRTFAESEYLLFDYKLSPRPGDTNTIPFWGGYQMAFKLIEKGSATAQSGELERFRREALLLGPGNSTQFSIEISKFEFVKPKVTKELYGYTYYVYAPQMIVFEKVRAICQQLPAYKSIIPSHISRARARDFYDIYSVMQHFSDIDVASPESREMLTEIFAVKKVPIEYIREIRNHLEIHRLDFESVKATVREKTEPFDFYAQFMLNLFEPLY